MKEKELNGQSLDIVAENIEKLKEIFPNIVEDGKIDFEKLQNLLGNYITPSNERYNFSWFGKHLAVKFAQTPTTGTLRPCKIESKNWDTTQNLYIEGDNLEVLKLLQKSYHKKIKMIYIDPPYNTGNDFVYNDDFKESLENYKKITGQIDAEGNDISTNSEKDGRYHTNWLNMMYPRLKLARNLLAPDGVIFISIDDDEYANLKKIVDEIFGEANFITTFIWEKKDKPSFLNKNLGTKTEYILCFAKDRNKTGAFSVDLTEAGKKYPFNNAGNGVKKLIFPSGSVKFDMKDCIIKPQDMSGGNIITKLLTQLEIKDGVNKNEFVLEGEWRYSQSALDEMVNNKEEIVISKIPFRPNLVKEGGEIKKMHNLLSIKHYDIATNEDAEAEQTKILGANYFDYAKPSGLIKLLAKAFLYNSPDAIVLDFFSGTSTTAHSIMQLNAEDGGTRKFIMVQLPELTYKMQNGAKKARKGCEKAFEDGYNNICEIGKERIRKTGEKIKQEIENGNIQLKIGTSPKQVPDIGFKVFKLDTSNIKKWVGNSENIANELQQSIFNYVEGRTQEDILYEVMLKCGLDLTYPVKEIKLGEKIIYTIGNGAMFVCMDDDITQEIADKIVEMTKENDMVEPVVVFKDNGFATDSVKTNIKETLRVAGIKDFITV